MRDRTKLVLAAATLALSGVIFGTARAGNLDGDYTNATINTGVYYFSVDMALGQRFCLTSPAYSGSILVDDITYSVDLDPCNPEDRCALLDLKADECGEDGWEHHAAGEVPPCSRTPHDAVQTGIGISPIGNGNYFISPTLSWFVVARGTAFIAAMKNQVTTRVFDRISHTMYGEIMSQRYLPQTYFPQVGGGIGWINIDDGPISALPIWPTDPIPLTSEANNLEFSLCAVNTSESRHYQTPEIVNFAASLPAGPGVQFTSISGGGISTYINANVSVKGRVIYSGTSGLPLPQIVTMAVH